jgi:hypothetical protein
MALVVGYEDATQRDRVTCNHHVHAADLRAGSMQFGSGDRKVRGRSRILGKA